MSTVMPILETSRLRIRPFTLDDLADAHRLLDVELAAAETGGGGALPLAEREDWLRWSVLNYRQLASLYQMPLGDRAVELKETGRLIGAAGYSASPGPYDALPAEPGGPPGPEHSSFTIEIGLYYAISPAYQRQGYAAEAASALIRYAFDSLNLRRVVALTSYDNLASIGVMHKLGLRIERNPYPDPPWFQVVGIAER